MNVVLAFIGITLFFESAKKMRMDLSAHSHFFIDEINYFHKSLGYSPASINSSSFAIS